MIKVIFGENGTGKTKTIIDLCNADAKGTNGIVAYITNNSKYSGEIMRNVRFVDVNGYHLDSKGKLIAFIQGMIAANHDVKTVYIDGVQRITKEKVETLGDFYDELEYLGLSNDVNFVVTCTVSEADMPDYLKKFI